MLKKRTLKILANYCNNRATEIQERSDGIMLFAYPGTFGYEKAIVLNKVAIVWLELRDEFKRATNDPKT